MGIHVSVYKQVPYGNSFLDNVDCTAGGESSYSKGFTIVNAEGPFEPCSDYPAAELIMEEPIGGRKCLRVVPLSKKVNGQCSVVTMPQHLTHDFLNCVTS